MSRTAKRIHLAVIGLGVVLIVVSVAMLLLDPTRARNDSAIFLPISATISTVVLAWAYRRQTKPVPPDQRPRRAAE